MNFESHFHTIIHSERLKQDLFGNFIEQDICYDDMLSYLREVNMLMSNKTIVYFQINEGKRGLTLHKLDDEWNLLEAAYVIKLAMNLLCENEKLSCNISNELINQTMDQSLIVA